MLELCKVTSETCNGSISSTWLPSSLHAATIASARSNTPTNVPNILPTYLLGETPRIKLQSPKPKFFLYFHQLIHLVCQLYFQHSYPRLIILALCYLGYLHICQPKYHASPRHICKPEYQPNLHLRYKFHPTIQLHVHFGTHQSLLKVKDLGVRSGTIKFPNTKSNPESTILLDQTNGISATESI